MIYISLQVYINHSPIMIRHFICELNERKFDLKPTLKKGSYLFLGVHISSLKRQNSMGTSGI